MCLKFKLGIVFSQLGRTALSLASFKGNKAVVDLLLKFGADVQISDKVNSLGPKFPHIRNINLP